MDIFCVKALSFLLTKGLVLKHIALEVFERLTFNYAASGRQQNREGEITSDEKCFDF